MKQKLFLFTIVIVVVLLIVRIIFFTPSEIEFEDPLRISAFVLDENINNPNDGFGLNKMNFEQLELNKVRLLAPVVNSRMWNLSIRLEYDGGLIDIISDDKDVYFSVGENGEAWREAADLDNRIYGFSQRVASGTYVAATPLSAYGGSSSTRGYKDSDGAIIPPIEGYTGREFYLTVISYDFSDESKPVVTAKLKLVQLEDSDSAMLYPDRSKYFSIELVSYEYSDAYKMMQ